MSNNKINSYPSVYAIGHSALAGIFDGPVVVEEKIEQLEGRVMFLENGRPRLDRHGNPMRAPFPSAIAIWFPW